MDKVLVVEDSEEIRGQLRWGLGKEATVLEAADLPQALAQFKKHLPRVVTLDLGLPPDPDGTSEGFVCLDAMLRINPRTKVVVLTGNDERETAYRAIQRGAYDYYEKPIDLADLRVIIARAFHLSDIEAEKFRLEEELNRKSCAMEGMIGDSPAMQKVFESIKKVATTDAPVLITGESGTGKEVVARALHSCSQRKGGGFIAINCGAIPENLMESELFGAEKGAFTGAYARVQGKVEYADKGTLFLDEVGELPYPLQVKLLRFLQEKVIQRVGGRDEVGVDARIVAATNVDLARAIREGQFREDLYYRIALVTIELPPLRRRGADLGLLANHFLHKSALGYQKKVAGFSAACLGIMESYEWPGNVRELQNRVQRGVIMADSALLGPEDLGFLQGETQHGFQSGELTLKEARESAEREIVLRTLKKKNGNVLKASETLGVSRPTLYEIMRKHGITSQHAEQ